MKQFILILLLISTGSFAQMTTVNSKQTLKISHWEFLNSDDGMIFLLGPESKQTLFIKVHTRLANSLPADPITVYCNSSMYHVNPGSSIKCYGNMNDSASMNIELHDFKNGSEGIYKFIPKSNF